MKGQITVTEGLRMLKRSAQSRAQKQGRDIASDNWLRLVQDEPRGSSKRQPSEKGGGPLVS